MTATFHVEHPALSAPVGRPVVTEADAAAYLRLVADARERLRQFAAANPGVNPLDGTLARTVAAA